MKNDKINILGINYYLEEKDIVSDDLNCCGQIDYQQLKIQIKKDLAEEMKKITLIHEILHGILHSTGNEELNNNEDLINRLSTSIYQIFKSNHTLTTYLF